MTPFKCGDLVLLAFPFSSGTGFKQRPALIILDPIDEDVLVARVTTQPYNTTFDVTIQGWSIAGLLAPSVVRLHKIATIEKTFVRRTLGHLSSTDWAAVRQKMRRMLE